MVRKLFAGAAIFVLVVIATLMTLADEIRKNPVCFDNLSAVAPVEASVKGDDVKIAGDSITVSGVTLNREQINGTELILGIALARGLDQRDAAITIGTAMQESGIRNLKYGDRDSGGFFQQRPSQGWGTWAQVTDGVYATNKFIDALLKVPGRTQQSLKEVAIKVQLPDRSHYDANWKWDAMATTLAANVYANAPNMANIVEGEVQQAAHQTSLGCIDGVGGNVSAAITAARSQIGVPYRWGGEEEGVGFDCSGLMRWAYGQAGVQLTGNSTTLWVEGTKVDRQDLQPGDLVYWNNGSAGPGNVTTHVAMWLGNDQVIEANRTGTPVRIAPMRWDTEYVGATRPVPNPSGFDSIATGGWGNPLGTANYRVTSGFGMRYHPILGISRLHAGADFPAPAGTPVYAASGGEVVFASYSGGRGNQVRILHGGGIMSVSAHLQRFAPGIQSGTRVQAGQLIGYVGSTGLSTGPHLHFEIHTGSTRSSEGTPVDPRLFLAGFGVRL